MKHPFLLFIPLLLFACTKDEVYGPHELENGQLVELLVDHRYGAIDAPLMLLPQNEPAEISLRGFNGREPGHTYRVKARLHAPDVPPQDGPSYWLDFLEVISKEKYQGNESFQIPLIKSYVPGGPVIALTKKDGEYHYVDNKLLLTYASDDVRVQLEEIWQHAREVWEESAEFLQLPIEVRENLEPPTIKWKFITATVTHDPENFGKAYRVEHIEFTAL